MVPMENNIIEEDTKTENKFSDYLLKEKFLLTALEFHFELLERGISCNILDEFFSNPENLCRFEVNHADLLSTRRLPV